MSSRSRLSLRAVLLASAFAAAVVVFAVGRRDGAPAWEIPALILIGVAVLVIHAATSEKRYPTSVVTTQAQPGASYEELHHRANPRHVSDLSTAERHGHSSGGVPTTTTHVGMTDVVVPAASFPDAGHGHGPVIRVADDMPPPPLHAVLQSDGLPVPPEFDGGTTPFGAPAVVTPPQSPPLYSPLPPPLPQHPPSSQTPPQPPPSSSSLAPPDPATILPGPGAVAPIDPVLLDLRPETEDPMVMRLIVGEPPPPGSRADVSSPDGSTSAPGPPPPPPPVG